MGDPLSITTGVLSLLATCAKVGWQLKQFHDGAAMSKTKVQFLLSDFMGFTRVLQSMEETFKQEKIKLTIEATGHIGSHWSNLSASISDGQELILKLVATLDKVNKNGSSLDGARKHVRLLIAPDEIAMYQQQIRSYRDTLQLSLQTIILWNQFTSQESATEVMPTLNALHKEIRRLAHDFNDQISKLQTSSKSISSSHKMNTLKTLLKTVKAASTVVSSASTVSSVVSSQYDDSEFGDCFPTEPSAALDRWLSADSIYDFDYEEPEKYNRTTKASTETIRIARYSSYSGPSSSLTMRDRFIASAKIIATRSSEESIKQFDVGPEHQSKTSNVSTDTIDNPEYSSSQSAVRGRLSGFRGIVAIRSREERIKTFNEMRFRFANMDLGLNDWLAGLQLQSQISPFLFAGNMKEHD